jgi:hypothetical protein
VSDRSKIGELVLSRIRTTARNENAAFALSNPVIALPVVRLRFFVPDVTVYALRPVGATAL